jgi:hypothetical protein
MERLYKPTEDGGAPYKNQDFFQFLQQNHIISYSAFLDEINDRSSGNCGIILKGITESHVFTQQLIDTIEPGSTPIPTGGLFSDYLALPSPRIIGDDNTTFLTSWANGQHLYYLDDNGLYVYVGQILTILTDKSLILTAPPINTPLPLSVLVSSEKPPIQVNSLSSQQVFWNLQNSLVYIDDYAHHPTEINAVHQAVRELYPNQKVLAVFQPHLFSRTKDFADDFATSLSQFDEVLLLDIYPARELPMPGITSSWLLEKINNKNKKLVSKEKLIKAIQESDAKVIVTIGAGDIGELVPSIKKSLL